MNFNPYLVFDVPMSADFEQLRATYRRLARENHPDVASNKLLATERMAQINRAWGILGDETKRAAFDAQWRSQNAEQARQEALRREATAREVARSNARRTTSSASRTASHATRSNSSSAPHPGSSRSGAPRSGKKNKRGGGTSLKAKLGWGSAPRTSPREGSKSQRASNAVFFETESSPQALRLMRKVTLATRVWHRDGNAKTAIEMCRAVLLSDGRNVPARELLSEIFAVQGRLELAVVMLDQAIQIAPDDLFLRRKRDHLERERFPNGLHHALARPSLWQRLRACFNRKNVKN